MNPKEKSLKVEAEKVFGMTTNGDPNETVYLYISENKTCILSQMAKTGVLQYRDGTPYVAEVGVASVKIKDARPGQLKTREVHFTDISSRPRHRDPSIGDDAFLMWSGKRSDMNFLGFETLAKPFNPGKFRKWTP